MKAKLNFKKSFSILIMALFFLTGTFELIAQENKAKLKDFKIIIEKMENGIKMKSIEGCAWIELWFSMNNYRPQAIDEFGMADLGEVSENNDKKFANFLFTIIQTENGIELKGIEGTAWIDLKFSLSENEKRAINQFGMTSLN